jgi:hypothetical protein
LIVSTAAALVQLRADNRSPKQRLAAAQDAVADAKSFKFEVTMSIAGAGQTMEASMVGEVDSATEQTSMRGKLFGIDIAIITAKDRAYVAVPDGRRGETGGKPFAAFTPERAEGAGSWTDVSRGMNPLDTFTQLDAIVGGVDKVGSEEVRGASAVHYRAKVDFVKLVLKAVGTTPPPGAAEALKSSQFDPMRRVPVDVWLDDNDRPVRYTMAMQLPTGTGAAGSMTMKMETFDFGAPVSIDIPGPDAVFETDQQFVGRMLSPR